MVVVVLDGSHMAHERGRRRILEGERERERKEGGKKWKRYRVELL